MAISAATLINKISPFPNFFFKKIENVATPIPDNAFNKQLMGIGKKNKNNPTMTSSIQTNSYKL